MSSVPDVTPEQSLREPSSVTTRRQFLSEAAGTAAGLAAMATPCWSAETSPQPQWDQLARTMRGQLLRPDKPNYAAAIKIWNQRYAHIRPAGVAMVRDAQDIATAIAWARDQQVELVARSGGHNYAGYSTTPGLVINLGAMTRVVVDPATGQLTTYGAAQNKLVATAAKPHDRAIPGGQCPTVGVAGFVLGGGLGFHMREHGLGIDSLLSTEVVTADGQLRQVSATEHPDLFWALRGGGGGNFGINTSFTFRTFAVPRVVTTYSLKWQGDDCARAFLALQDILLAGPNTIGLIANFSAALDAKGQVQPEFEILGQAVLPLAETQRLFAPVVKAHPPHETEMQARTFWEAKLWLSEETNAPKPFAERSRFHAEPLSAAGAELIVETLRRAPLREPQHFVESSFFAWGGQVNTVAPDATAFVHRRDTWLQTFNCSWGLNEQPAASQRLMAWQDEFYTAMSRYASDRAFQNFPDPQLERPLEAYYGTNLPRLIALKQKYDPDQVFRFAQSIRAA